ncbi:TIGR02300 family protein [Jannaschia formosa]|uniref:TIGR02300 family protein n=1 Tax=Jannaschia formosa TaxID=2259592 RepID=UPI000E1B6B52|nr:TIGR02300 family protein [Jannaschia formosa]TFL18351.1 TIGR02300 family protein [Jannaschia formosa]
MPKDEWGVKRVCPTTGKRFYDLNKDPIVSPYTGEVVTVDTGARTRILTADKDDIDAKKKGVEDDDLLLDDDDVDIEDDDDAAETGDDVLDDEDDETVSLDDLADVDADKDDD